jgi:hypothetical protein
VIDVGCSWANDRSVENAIFVTGEELAARWITSGWIGGGTTTTGINAGLEAFEAALDGELTLGFSGVIDVPVGEFVIVAGWLPVEVIPLPTPEPRPPVTLPSPGPKTGVAGVGVSACAPPKELAKPLPEKKNWSWLNPPRAPSSISIAAKLPAGKLSTRGATNG